MQVTLSPVDPSNVEALRNLWQLYLYESSEDVEVDERGLCHPLSDEFLQVLMAKTARDRAYLLHLGPTLVGFLLIEDAAIEGRQILEFADIFILRRHRRRGLATAVFRQVVLMSEHPWLLAVFRKDKAALAHWEKVFSRTPELRWREKSPPEIAEFHEFILNERHA
ncbi:MAG: hypothetical protein ACK5TK_18000 [Betaproteobacteria bacterium]